MNAVRADATQLSDQVACAVFAEGLNTFRPEANGPVMTPTTQRILFYIELRKHAAACGAYVFLDVRSDISGGLHAMANERIDEQGPPTLALHAQRGQNP